MTAVARKDLEFVPDADTAPAAAAASVASRVDPETVVRGKIEVSGTLEVFGKVDGEIDAGTLKIEAGGSMTGEVKAEVMVIAGTFKGTLRCKFLTLTETAKVEGEIHYERLAVASGAEVEAAFRPGATVTL